MSTGNTFYLYSLKFPNGKLYIGVSKSPKFRWTSHLKASERGSNYPVHNAIRLYGWENVEKKIIDQGEMNYILQLEIDTIAALSTRNDLHGYNLCHGGQMSPMLDKRISAKLSTPEARAAFSKGQTGRKHSVSSCIKRSESLKRTMSTPEFKSSRSAMSRAIHTPEMLARKSASVRQAFQNPEVKEKHRLALIASHARRKALKMNETKLGENNGCL